MLVMQVLMCVCVYVCMCTHTCMCAHVCVCVTHDSKVKLLAHK